jgi:hypothetical protein
VIIGALESCGDIISVSCTENEIFILKGDRDIVRISNAPEDLASNSTMSYIVHRHVIIYQKHFVNFKPTIES